MKQRSVVNTEGVQRAKNCVSILLPVFARKRAKPDTAKVNGKTLIGSLQFFNILSAGRLVPGALPSENRKQY